MKEIIAYLITFEKQPPGSWQGDVGRKTG